MLTDDTHKFYLKREYYFPNVSPPFALFFIPSGYAIRTICFALKEDAYHLRTHSQMEMCLSADRNVVFLRIPLFDAPSKYK